MPSYYLGRITGAVYAMVDNDLFRYEDNYSGWKLYKPHLIINDNFNYAYRPIDRPPYGIPALEIEIKKPNAGPYLRIF